MDKLRENRIERLRNRRCLDDLIGFGIVKVNRVP